tara:strand:- start:401 stop:502 length:102 start_codon:yes stop_codon:yes gene_type:complete
MSSSFKKNFNQKYENILKWRIKNPGYLNSRRKE